MPAILSALEDKIRIPARPCNILYIYHMPSKQNHAITLIFFARTFGELTDSAAPLLNLLELVIVNSVHRLHALRSTNLWHKYLLRNVFHDFLQYAKNLHTSL